MKTTMPSWERGKIERRISKTLRRIANGYKTPAGQEQLRTKLSRLEKLVGG